MPDLKITELPVLTRPISGNDIGVLVKSGGPPTDAQFSFTQLLNFIGVNLPLGSAVSFLSVTPANENGKEGDVVIKTTTGEFWQKTAGVWVVKYTIVPGVIGSKIYYGSTAPSPATGINGDTYLQTDGGLFYTKVSGAWVLQFSMASGPPGPRGNSVLNGVIDPTNDIGLNGDFYLNTVTDFIFGPKSSGVWPAGVSLKGVNGNTILTGTTPPSNTDDGVNGDYFINKNTWYIYGPKAGGVWPDGVPLQPPPGSTFKVPILYSTLDTRFTYDADTGTLTFTLDSDLQAQFPLGPNSILQCDIRQNIGSTRVKYLKNVDTITQTDGTKYISIDIEGFFPGAPGADSILLY